MDAIEKRLSNLCVDKACGADGVSPLVLKACAGAFARPFSLIFSRSMTEGRVPSQWKEANVSPIFKKGSRVIAANYRPVSLLLLPGKILEGVVRDGLMS